MTHHIEHITTKSCIALAMMADALDGALVCVRANDGCGAICAARFHCVVFLVLVRVAELHQEGEVVSMFSYIRHMLEWRTLLPAGLTVRGTATARFSKQKPLVA